MARSSVNAELLSSELRQAQGSDEWLMYGHSYDNDRTSPAQQITVANVHRLAPRFIVQMGTRGPIEGSPIYARGVLYLVGWQDDVIAVNATDGTRLWEYKPSLRRTRLCCGAVSRGVAVADGMVFVAQADARLVALDQFSGKLLWSVDVASTPAGYSMTTAPLVFDDKVIVGVAGGEFGIRGFIRAYNVADGSTVWTWNTIDPRNWAGSFAPLDPCGHDLHRNVSREHSQWPKYHAAWKRGGGPVWTPPAIDIRSDRLFLTTGNPWPDERADERPGDNLHTNSIVALNANTGGFLWAMQEVPHDMWDLDPASPPVLIKTLSRSGVLTDAVAEAGKTGWVYEVARSDGRLIRCSDGFVPHANVFSRAAKRPMSPSDSGGANWSPVAYNQRLGTLLVMGSARIWHEAHFRRSTDQISGHYERFATVTAINVDDGTTKWQRRLPFGSVGGVSETASGVGFYGDSDGYLNAVDVLTGHALWRFQTGAGVNAPPSIYMDEAAEYVIVGAGGNQQMGTVRGDTYIVFGLPAT